MHLGRPAAAVVFLVAVGLTSAASADTPAQPDLSPTAMRHQPPPSVTLEPLHPVGRIGTQLALDGAPFQFTGLNIFNAANLDSTSCWFPWGTGDALDRALTAIGPAQSVFRVWFYQRTATVGGRRDWRGFDHTLAVAREHGERILVTLGNQWNDCEGTGATFKTESWYLSGYWDEPAPGLRESYRDWVAEVVSRYHDDGTILAWQLMNEPSDPISRKGGCSPTAGVTLQAFVKDIASLIKEFDRTHLISVGTLGGGECGSAGTDYQALHSIPEIDLCNFHDYSPAYPAGQPRDMDLLEQHLAECKQLNKPLLISEAGVTVRDAGSLRARARIFQARLGAWFKAGVAGVLIWDLGAASDAGGPGYAVLPGDPLLPVLAKIETTTIASGSG